MTELRFTPFRFFTEMGAMIVFQIAVLGTGSRFCRNFGLHCMDRHRRRSNFTGNARYINGTTTALGEIGVLNVVDGKIESYIIAT